MPNPISAVEAGLSVVQTQLGFQNMVNANDPVTQLNEMAQMAAGISNLLGSPIAAIYTNAGAAMVTIAKMHSDARNGKPLSGSDVLSLAGNVVTMAAATAIKFVPVGRAAGILAKVAMGIGMGQVLAGGISAANASGITTQAISPTLGATPDPLVKTIRYIYGDPLILDLDGDGLEIAPLSQGILFDANGDGIKTGTAWVGADDGLVVLDRNGDGLIGSGAELFGDETVLADGRKAADGFAALAELDGNRDGVFDAADTRYNAVRIWRDLDQDGISQAGELKTLAESGVQSIKLASAATGAAYLDAYLRQSGSYTRTDGSTGQAGSFALAQNNFARAFAPIAISAAAEALPDIGGSGWVRDLREAASLSPELIAAYGQAKDTPTRASYKNAVATLLREWGNGSAYHSAGKQALAAGYGLTLSDPEDDQERGWMDTAIKAGEAERNAYRATLSEEDRGKFDAMRERMVGGLEKIYAYEAFEAFTLEAANDGEWRRAA